MSSSFLSNVGLNLYNPFTSVVGQKIEEATDSNQASENWALIIEVCDLINGTEDGPKDAIKAIRKRLQQNAGKNYKTILYTLTLLEACVKNCDRKFHVLVCNKEFIQELIKLIGPKNDPPSIVQEKVLNLIQSWADAFHNQPELSAVVQIYNDLKKKGIEFPMTDLDTMAPIHTPRKTVQIRTSPKHYQQSSPTPDIVDSSTISEGVLRLNGEQLAKLRSELDIVRENMTILNEMLTELTPGNEHPSDLELLNQLYNTCKAMQDRLVELISQLANDEVTADLLRMNDLLNNLFLRYSRYEKNRSAQITPQASAPETATLINLDFDGDQTDAKLVNDFNKLNVQASGSKSAQSTTPVKTKPDAEFDMFAQSRGATYESSKKEGSSYEDNLKPNQLIGGLGAITQSRSQPPSLMHRESDFDEMAAWLGEQAAANESESLTSSEFDRFLAERAAAAENLPTEPSSAASPSRNTTSHRNKYSSVPSHIDGSRDFNKRNSDFGNREDVHSDFSDMSKPVFLQIKKQKVNTYQPVEPRTPDQEEIVRYIHNQKTPVESHSSQHGRKKRPKLKRLVIQDPKKNAVALVQKVRENKKASANRNTVEVNVQKLLKLSDSNIAHTNKEKKLLRKIAKSKSKKGCPKTEKKKETPVFTEEDFAKFEKEFFAN
ncbi:hypothetical protein V9T40_007790 [Parthenolecanium corni]|uniref:TOM1-like protein 2 n=1 Tax=Parthenolecanium corni TaxID=536013 RepID=A0AAN9TIA2_9HEMI